MGKLYPMPIGGDHTIAASEAIDLAHEKPFSVGSIDVIPYRLLLQRNGVAEHVEPKVMQVLVALARQPRRIFSRDDLIDCCWDGRIVGDASVTRVISLLRAAIRDLGEDSVEIETLPKVGYRLLLDMDGGDVRESHKAGVTPPLIRRRWVPPLVLALFALAGAIWWMFISAPVQERRLAVAMMPIEFAQDQHALTALGLEERLRSMLAESGDITLNASPSIRALAREHSNPNGVARALESDYVVSGSYRQDGDRAILDLAVHSDVSEQPLWAYTFNRPVEELGLLPEEALWSVRQALGLQTETGETRTNMTRDDHRNFLIAVGTVRTKQAERIPPAEQMLQDLDTRYPENPQVMLWLARAKLLTLNNGSEPASVRKAAGIELLNRTLEIQPNNARALATLAFYSDGPIGQRLRLAQQSARSDPGNSETWLFLGTLALANGQAEEALNAYERIAILHPMWVRAALGYDLAISMGEAGRAEAIMARLRAVTDERGHHLLLDAAEARASGDLSTAVAQLRIVAMNEIAGRQQTARFLLNGILSHLGLIENVRVDTFDREFEYFRAFLRGDFPARSAWAEVGESEETFWTTEIMRFDGVPTLVAQGRSAELLEFYDMQAAGPRELMDFMPNRQFDFRVVAPYLAIALHEGGRDAEAQEVIAMALAIDDAFAADDAPRAAELVRSAQIRSVAGEHETAIALLQQARELGMPHFSAFLLEHRLVRPLRDDPAFAGLRGDPRFQAMDAQIEAHRARERSETLAEA